MLGIPSIGHRDQSLVEPPLASSAFVTPDQEDGLPPGVEGKGHSPDLAVPVKPKFFHVGVFRGLEGVDSWPSQVGPKLRQQARMGQHFILQVICQQGQLVAEIVVKDHFPADCFSMDWKP